MFCLLNCLTKELPFTLNNFFFFSADFVFVVDMEDTKDAARMQHIKNFMISSVSGLGLEEFGNHVAVVGYKMEKAAKEG